MQRLIALNLPFAIHSPMSYGVDGKGTLNPDWHVQVIDHQAMECYSGHGKTFDEAVSDLLAYMRKRAMPVPTVTTGNVVGGPIDGATIPADPDSTMYLAVMPFNSAADGRSYYYVRQCLAGGRWLFEPEMTARAQLQQSQNRRKA